MNELEETASKAGKPKLRVLIVDYDDGSRELAAITLERCGYEADVASNGQDALDMFERAEKQGRPYAIALVNRGLPGNIRGVQVVGEATKRFNTLVIATTADYDRPGAIEELIAFGASRVLAVPYTSASSIPTAVAEVLYPPKDSPDSGTG